MDPGELWIETGQARELDIRVSKKEACWSEEETWSPGR